jgi:ArsR family transcriptional regulator, lead/cadmium/zinc/bismuth-responsive transcriptional repressor
MNAMSPIETCEIKQVDPEAVARAQRNMPDARVLERAVQILKAGADETRLRILMALTQSELCVCDLATLTDVSESAVSHQLRDLRDAQLIKSEKRGRMVYYRLDDDHVAKLLENAIEHALEKTKTF